MLSKILAWLLSFFVSPSAEPSPAPGPKKITNIVDAIIEALKEQAGDHPILLQMLEWIDELVEEHGEVIFNAIERAVLTFLAAKYPWIAPLLMSAEAQIPNTDDE